MEQMVPVTPDELVSLFDGHLSPTDARALEARLSAFDRATLQAWAEQREQLRALGQEIAQEALPPELQQTGQQLSDRHGRAHRRTHLWQRWGGMAASLVLAFGAGWWVRGGEVTPASTALVQPSPVLASAGFVHHAAVAHAVYTPEVRHPVEVPAEQQAHLVQWLSKRLERSLRIPDMSAMGYDLVGGRLLPGSEGARAQFMYQRADGTRITLYLGAVQVKEMPGADQATAFAFARQGDVSSFYWVDQGFGYALSGRLPRTELLKLAEVAHAHL